MAIDLWWDELDATVIRARFSANWTWDDYRQSNAEVLRMAHSVPHRVDMITDFTACRRFPKGASAAYVRELRANRPPNFQLIIVVCDDKFVQMMVNLWNKLFDPALVPSLTSPTLPAAYDMLYRLRQESDR